MNILNTITNVLKTIWKIIKIVGAFICGIFVMDTVHLIAIGQIASKAGAAIFLLINCFIIYEVLRTELKFW